MSLFGLFKSEDEKWAKAATSPRSNARMRHGQLSADQVVSRQIKSSDLQNNRRATRGQGTRKK